MQTLSPTKKRALARGEGEGEREREREGEGEGEFEAVAVTAQDNALAAAQEAQGAGMLVIDPMCGSGTLPELAARHGLEESGAAGADADSEGGGGALGFGRAFFLAGDLAADQVLAAARNARRAGTAARSDFVVHNDPIIIATLDQNRCRSP